MTLFPTTILCRRALLVFFWLLSVHVSSALSPDPRLLSLVVPGSHLVGGMNAPSPTGQPDNFLLITHNRTISTTAMASRSQACGTSGSFPMESAPASPAACQTTTLDQETR
jgi:hypothetical protein